MSKKIDDPVDAAQAAWPEDSDGMGGKFANAALSLGGLVFPPAAILKILKDQFLPDNRGARIRYLIQAFAVELKKLEAEHGESRQVVTAMRAQLDGPAFREAVAVALEESARAVNTEKIRQFAAILVGSLIPRDLAVNDDDLAPLIRDVAQLGNIDIKILGILEETFRNIYQKFASLGFGTNQFSEHIDDLTRAINAAHMHSDDFYGTCLRLSGFGLATEDRPTIRANGERCFRATRRSLALLTFLRESDRRNVVDAK